MIEEKFKVKNVEKVDGGVEFNILCRIEDYNVIDEQIVERRQSAVKVKFTFVNNDFVVLLMTEAQYAEFKKATADGVSVINLECSVVELLKG